ncbi:MAG: hypothetical protein Q7R41_10590 [Phycisphaerales bacterium]|nr:hypothetical protein [Phycisphaerales bacterium]
MHLQRGRFPPGKGWLQSDDLQLIDILNGAGNFDEYNGARLS